MVEIHKIKDIKTKNPTVIIGFPGTGLVGSVAASQIIDSLKLEFVGYITSESFAPLAAIHDYVPLPAARIHYSEQYNLVVILSEMSIPVATSMELAQKIYEYMTSIKAKEAITLGGICMHEGEDKIYAISTDLGKVKELEKKKIANSIKEGATTGVAGTLLTMGTVLKFPVLSILAESSQDELDPKAAANAILALSKILNIKIDIKELQTEAKDMEKQMKNKMIKSKIISKKPTGSMYG
ncbi:MAG: PAC2 family protein [Candidatus Micrarchaeota archaeon]